MIPVLRIACYVAAAYAGAILAPVSTLIAIIIAFVLLGLIYALTADASISRSMKERYGIEKRKFHMPILPFFAGDILRGTIICGTLFGIGTFVRHMLDG